MIAGYDLLNEPGLDNGGAKDTSANRHLRDVIEVCEANHWSWAYHVWREWEGRDA